MRTRIDLQTGFTAIGGLFMVLSFFGLHPAIPYVSIAAGSIFAVKTAYASVRERNLDVNLLMVLAAIGAIVVGQPTDAAVLLFLFSLSNTLESLAMARTRSAIEALVKLRPTEATLVREGTDSRVPVETVQRGDLIRIRPFEGVPLDADIVEGVTSVNESTMTGESIPVSRGPGDTLLAGTTNVEGMVLCRVTGAVGDSTLDRIVHLVEEAQENKASGERVSQWFGKRYTGLVVGACLLSLAVRYGLGHAWADAFYQSLTLLVALSPCALVISSPASTLSALAWAAKHGILVRGGAFVEIAGQIDCIALDKTGTLTTGTPQLMEICVCAAVPTPVGARTCSESDLCWSEGRELSREAADLLRLAAGAEQYSDHPIADAIVRRAREFGVDVPEATGTSVTPGHGVSALIGGQSVKIGQPKFFESSPMASSFVEEVGEMQSKGMTVAILQSGDRFAAFGLADTVRADSGDALKALREAGVERIVMLTGDNENTARSVAERLGIEDFRAGLLPEDKSRIVRELIGEGHRVMMVGDGVNDAPVLKGAHLGVAMGGLGSDVALEAADVVLMRDRLGSLADLIRLGRRARGVIAFNLAFAGGVILVLAAVSLFGKLPLPIAVVGHEGSTVVVILNGLRLLKGPGRSRGEQVSQIG